MAPRTGGAWPRQAATSSSWRTPTARTTSTRFRHSSSASAPVTIWLWDRDSGGRIEPGAMPWTHRHIGSPILSGLLNLLYRTGIDDAHCGMRAFRRSKLDDMRLRMPGMEFASEMVVNAARAGLRIGEVPVNYRVRGGTSKLRTVPDGWRHLRFLMLYSPTHLFLFPGLFLLAVGLILLVVLLPGPVVVLGRLFDIHVMVLGALLTLIGFQVLAIGLYAKTLAVTLRLQPMDRTQRMLRRAFSLERGLAAGLALFIIGFGVDFGIAARWVASGFGPLNEVRPALFRTGRDAARDADRVLFVLPLRDRNPGPRARLDGALPRDPSFAGPDQQRYTDHVDQGEQGHAQLTALFAAGGARHVVDLDRHDDRAAEVGS